MGRLSSLRALSLALVVTGLGMAPLWLIGALAPQMQQELGFGAAALGAAVALYQGTAAVFSVPGGIFVARHGWNAGAMATIALFLLATAGIAVTTQTYTVLLVFVVLGGIAAGLSAPAANLGLVESIGARRRALAFGIKQTASPAASMLAGLSVPLLAVQFGWRIVFGLAAAVAVPMIALRVGGSRPSTAMRRRRTSAKASPAGPVLLLAGAAGLGTAATSSLGSFYVVSALAGGIEAGTAGFLLSAGSVASVMMRIYVGWQATRRMGGHLLVVATMMALGGFGTALLAGSSDLLILLPATLLAFGLGWGWNGLFDFALVDRVADSPATATGVGQTGKNLGGLVGPMGFGLLAQFVGYHAAWFAAGGSLLVGGVAVLVARRWVLRLRRSMPCPSPPPADGADPGEDRRSPYSGDHDGRLEDG